MKTVLLAVCGLTPQVITETLYALHQNQQAVNSIHVITTRDGKERIYAELLTGAGGHFHRYLKEYGIHPREIDFSHKNVHVVVDEHGVEVPDIVTEEDNEQLLKTCLTLAFRFTSDPETTVCFSIAGGRKTMSSCLTLAAEMYGRPQDRLYHVLVTPEFEGNRDFFYPTKASRTIELRDTNGQPYFKETRFARINLIHIPFVSIRKDLSPDLLKEPRDPGTLLLSLVREETPQLRVDLLRGKVVYRTLELDLMPAQMALYGFFAREKKNCPKGEARCSGCTDCFVDIQTVFARQDDISNIYRGLSRGRPLEEMSDTGITHLSSENFNMYKGKIKAALLARFGPYALKDLEIGSEGTRPNTRYGIRMERSRIEIVY